MSQSQDTVRGVRGMQAYGLRASGKSWAEVAEVLQSHSESAAQKVAQKFAQGRGMPWPIILPKPEPQPKVFKGAGRREAEHARQKRAYDLREAGDTWGEIAQATGYCHPSNAIESVRRYATRMNLPWPVVPKV